MMWIEYRKGETIPDYLLYPNYQTDKSKNGRTPFMYWIAGRQGEDIP